MITALVLLLAWANGANDVAKGVATLAGSSETNARSAIYWGTSWTVIGGLTGIVWGKALISNFSTGFLAPGFEISNVFIGSTMTGASLWVILSTRLGLPVSTTHALLGGLVGAVLMISGPDGIQIAAVSNKAVLPLLVSPLLAVLMCWTLLFLARRAKLRVANWNQMQYEIGVGRQKNIHQGFWRSMHWLSSATISFARGLNDVPKIAAFLVLIFALRMPLGGESQNAVWAICTVAVVMGLGSLWGGFRILKVLAYEVVDLQGHRGLTANLGTSFVVLAATPLGLPVSTTHVSTGSLIGVRWADSAKPSDADALKIILFGWVITVPVAALLAGLSVILFQW